MARRLPLCAIIAEKRDIGQLTVMPHAEAFGRLEDIRVTKWEEEVGELAKWTWKRMVRNPNWEEMADFIESWRRMVLVSATVGYHNLVVRWNP